MNAKVVIETSFSQAPLFRQGKVRDVYDLGEQLLIVATDRISAFDVVLNQGIPYKGKVLTGMASFWFKTFTDVADHHLVSTDLADLPAGLQAHGDQLEGRFMLVKRTEPFPVECIVRGYIAGSAWKEYKKSGTVCGLPQPGGMAESQAFEKPLFTPTTKAESGHDENLAPGEIENLVGAETAEVLARKSIALYERAAAFARERGIIIADTKLEWGKVGDDIVVIDEMFTPDSSRFWPADQYEPGRSQPSFDKQFVRDWLETQTWDKTPPAPDLPDDVVEKTSAKYREAMEKLTGKTL